MNSKQRVYAALRRNGLPDRVPLQFGLSRAQLTTFGAKYGIPVHYSTSYYEDVICRISGNALLPFRTPAQIEADVRAKIGVLGRGGGYLCTPVHIVQADAPPENVQAFLHAVQKCGVYAQRISLPRRNRR